MKFWLMKSEPDVYSIDDLASEPNQTDYWDGIRNYQARNLMRDEMSVNDKAFFYHSNCKIPGIVGIMKIARSTYPDPTAFDANEKYYDPKSDPKNPRWLMVDVKFVLKFPHIVSLAQMREEPALAEMRVLQRGNRLSITPVTDEEWQHILCMAEVSL